MKRTWFIVAAAVVLVVAGSIAVWQLSGNEERRAGALTDPSEPLPLAWRGAWSADQTYAAGEVVSDDGIAFVAERATEGESPARCGEDCPWAALGGVAQQTPAATGGGLTWRGPYVITRPYQKDDVVQENGSAWIALTDVPACDAGNLAGSVACYLVNAPARSQSWALLASKGDAGAQGPKGDPGPQGPKGDPGPQGPKGDAAALTRDVVLATKGPSSCAERHPILGYCTRMYHPEAKATCPPGKVATGGGYRHIDSVDEVSWSLPDDNGWVAGPSTLQLLTVFAVCIG